MRHGIYGNSMGRTLAHSVAMRRNLVSSLFEHGKITTTLPKARNVQRVAERLITMARKGTLHARRLVIARMQDRDFYALETKEGLGDFLTTAVHKLFDEVAPKYVGREGGYTRIVRTSRRRIGDGGEIVVLQLVEPGEPARKKPTNVTPRRRRAKARYALLEKRADKTESAAAEKPAEEQPAEQQGADQAPAEQSPAEQKPAEDKKE